MYAMKTEHVSVFIAYIFIRNPFPSPLQSSERIPQLITNQSIHGANLMPLNNVSALGFNLPVRRDTSARSERLLKVTSPPLQSLGKPS